MQTCPIDVFFFVVWVDFVLQKIWSLIKPKKISSKACFFPLPPRMLPSGGASTKGGLHQNFSLVCWWFLTRPHRMSPDSTVYHKSFFFIWMWNENQLAR